MTRSQTKRDPDSLSRATSATTSTSTPTAASAAASTASGQTVIGETSSSTTTQQPIEPAVQTTIPAGLPKEKKKARPTQPEDEFFYEQAKFFRHLERRHNRFVKTTQEDEQRARQGKLKVRTVKPQAVVPGPTVTNTSPNPISTPQASTSSFIPTTRDKSRTSIEGTKPKAAFKNQHSRSPASTTTSTSTKSAQ